MPPSQTDWDAKHSLAAREAAEAPAGILAELCPLLPTGAALDLACGRGRNAIFLAEHGRPVTAVDWSAAALDLLEKRAQALHLPVRRIQRIEKAKQARAGIDLVLADLESAQLEVNGYFLILCVRYLQRSLFPQICGALRPGGMLLFETYTKAQLDFPGGPRNPAHLLDKGELRKAFPELQTVFYRELRAEQGIASLAARKPQGHSHRQ
ncbi:MAG TPA: class I SAM-dependent methyltransferase [Candidatus Acidoferrum sp.]|jgi:SAM-dependent methyltransferase|nr:class I SAM-dependent methyltransferase [Candidatus Acidoferrum sp.]